MEEAPGDRQVGLWPRATVGRRVGSAMLYAPEDRGWKRFATAHAILLGGYLLFDRAFAWVHVPGIPLFVGEVVLLIGGLGLIATHLRPGRLIRQSLALSLIVIYGTWGFLLLVLGVGDYSLDALRDSTIWLYGAFAVLMAMSLLVRPMEWWIERYQRILPWLILWLPAALVLDALFGDRAPLVPDSSTTILSHWSPNVGIHAAIGLGFMWAVPVSDRLRRYRVPLSSVAVLTTLAAGFSSRAGLLAVSIGALVLLAGIPRGRARLIWLASAVVGVVLSVAILFTVEIDLWEDRGRSLSAQQLVDNVTSIVTPERADPMLVGTSEWRTDFWARVLSEVNTNRSIAGFGFGPNLRDIFGEQDEDPPARNPHNSHVTVVARMGWVGGVLWALMWTSWFWELVRSRKRFTRAGLRQAAGLATVLMAGAIMFLVNGIFNEVVEGPHSAVWMWSIFGFGAFLSASRPRPVSRQLTFESVG